MALSPFFVDPALFDVSREMTRALEPFFQPMFPAGRLSSNAAQAAHPMDIVEHQDRYSIMADAPGFTPEDITVELVENKLVITGEKRSEKEVKEDQKGVRVHRRERTFNKFTRSFTVPEGTKVDNISAQIEHGVLTVDIPKEVVKPKVPEPKRIQVMGGTNTPKLTDKPATGNHA